MYRKCFETPIKQGLVHLGRNAETRGILCFAQVGIFMLGFDIFSLALLAVLTWLLSVDPDLVAMHPTAGAGEFQNQVCKNGVQQNPESSFLLRLQRNPETDAKLTESPPKQTKTKTKRNAFPNS